MSFAGTWACELKPGIKSYSDLEEEMSQEVDGVQGRETDVMTKRPTQWFVIYPGDSVKGMRRPGILEFMWAKQHNYIYFLNGDIL